MIIINNKKYILSDDILTTCPIWCKGIRNGRELVKKKSILEARTRKNSTPVKKSSGNKSHKKSVSKVSNKYTQNYEKYASYAVIKFGRYKENKVTTMKGPSARKE